MPRQVYTWGKKSPLIEARNAGKDVMDTISGTRGISGCVDGTMVLEKETRLGTATELLAFLKEINGKLKNQPNTLTRYLDAQSGPLRERYGVEYTN